MAIAIAHRCDGRHPLDTLLPVSDAIILFPLTKYRWRICFLRLHQTGRAPGNNNICIEGERRANGNGSCNSLQPHSSVTAITPTIGNQTMSITHDGLTQNNNDVTGGGLGVITYCINTSIDEHNSSDEIISLHPNPATTEIKLKMQKQSESVEIFQHPWREVYNKAEGSYSNAKKHGMSKAKFGNLFL